MSFTRQQRFTKSRAIGKSWLTNHGAGERPARVLVECDGCRKQVEKLNECAGKFLCGDCKKSTSVSISSTSNEAAKMDMPQTNETNAHPAGQD